MARIYIKKFADGIKTKGNTAHESMEIHVYAGSVKNSVTVADIKIEYPDEYVREDDDLIATVSVDGIIVKRRYMAKVVKD